MTFDLHTPEVCSAAEWRDVDVRYPFTGISAVGPVTLRLRRGERVLLLGASGSGKSTLLLTLTGLIPNSIPAEVRGKISIGGTDVGARKPAGWACEVAQYFQDADQTLCGMGVEDEIAFALENRSMPEAEIANAVGAAMRDVGLPDEWRKRRSSTLSGGERQLVALAATLAQGASLFVADEPTAHLAPEAASRLHALLARGLASQTMLIVDHRLDGLIQTIDRMVVLGTDSTIIADGNPRTIFREMREVMTALGIWCPASTGLDAELAEIGLASPTAPLSIEEALAHLDPSCASGVNIERAKPVVAAFVAKHCASADTPASDAPVVAELRGAACAPFLGPVVLRDVDFRIREGEIVGILGANGAGKSTLGLSLAGLLPLKGGKRQGAAGGVAFQRSENQFVGGTVSDELHAALPKQTDRDKRARDVAEALEMWGLGGLDGQHPYELSQGQKRRLALATLTIADRWPLLVLDEPLAGLDAAGAASLTTLVAGLVGKGRAVAMITHDMDLALRLCRRSIVVGDGRILADGLTIDLLTDAELLARADLAEPSSAAASRWLHRVAAC